MVRKTKEHDLARYYRERGYSYSEIATLCKVSKGTISSWFSSETFSQEVKKDNQTKAVKENVKRLGLINKARKAERSNRYKEAVRTAELEFKHYKDDPLFIAGLMLYLGEGDNKDSSKIRIANSRFSVHRIFIQFLLSYLDVSPEKIRFWVLLYPDLDEKKVKNVWQKKLKLKNNQWYKNQVINGKSKKRTLHFGVGNTIIVSTVLKLKLARWIELAEKEL